MIKITNSHLTLYLSMKVDGLSCDERGCGHPGGGGGVRGHAGDGAQDLGGGRGKTDQKVRSRIRLFLNNRKLYILFYRYKTMFSVIKYKIGVMKHKRGEIGEECCVKN